MLSRWIWRDSQGESMGKWAELDAPRVPAPAANLPEVHYGGWVGSSFDLLSGVDVVDNPDTIPSELYDELFAERRPPSGTGE
jgi:hypothetical protein